MMRSKTWTTMVTVGLAAGLIAFACGCGGGQKTGDGDDGEGFKLEDRGPEYEPVDDVMIPPEKYDEVNRALEKRGPGVSRCFAAAIEAGEVGKNEKGTVVVGVGVTPAGKATDVKVLPTSSLKKPGLSACVVEYIEATRFPTLPKRLDTTYAYKLVRDY